MLPKGLMVSAALLVAPVAACSDDNPVTAAIERDEVVHQRRITGGVRQLAVSPLDGGSPRQLTNFVRDVALPAVSPDGRFIVYQQLQRLWVYEVAAGEARQLTFGPSGDGSARWSPDGEHIVYASTRLADPPTSDICIRRLSGGEPVCLTPPDEYDDALPDMSPDGTQIVWQRYDANLSGDIWIMNADGSDQRLMLDYSDYDDSPQWSPDGRAILFRSFRYGLPSQFILELATGNIRPVLGDSLDPAFMESATWGPDGQSVIIEVLNPNNRFAEVDLATGATRFINNDTLSYNSWPSMRRR